MTQAVSQAFKPYARIASLVLAVCAFPSAARSIGARPSRGKNRPVIRVVVYNYADVARLELRVAELQATSLFAEANVRVVWLEYSRKALSAPSGYRNLAQDFCLRILHASTIKPTKGVFGSEALGQSFIPPGVEAPVPGGFANVFYDNVTDVSTLSGLHPGEVLGEAIAHELGHLLLGARHSRQGIMKAHWTSRDLELISSCELRFSARQVKLLQVALMSLKGNSSPMDAARR